MRFVSLWLPIIAVALLLGSTGASLGQTPSGELAKAHVVVEVEPAQELFRGTGTVPLTITLQGDVVCLQASPPAPLLGILIPGDDAQLHVSFTPSQFELPWQRASGTDTGAYTVNETLEAIVTIIQAPQQRVVTDFHVLLRPAEGHEPHCTNNGYTITQSERHQALTLEPEALEGTDDLETRTPFNWVPLLLAVALLGIVAVFAFRREKQDPP